MTKEFLVITTSRFDRELKKLTAKHRDLSELFQRVIEILKSDPLQPQPGNTRLRNWKPSLLARASIGFAPDVSGFAMTWTARRFFSRHVPCAGRIPTGEIP